MSHKDAPPETQSQRECREWWTAREPHVTRAWGRAKDGSFLAESSRSLHAAWETAAADTERLKDMLQRVVDHARSAHMPITGVLAVLEAEKMLEELACPQQRGD